MIKIFTRLYLSLFSKHRKTYHAIRHITGFYPGTLTCYLQALRHHSASSTIHENGSRDSNERLEYLGDSVLNTVVAELLFNKFPYKNEGFLTEMRSKIVSRESLNELAMKIGLSQLVIYDKRLIGINSKNSIFGNALEAFIGAIFLDSGFGQSKRFIIKKLISHIDLDKLQYTEKNFKGRLIEWGQKQNRVVDFDTLEEMEKKQRIFKVTVLVDKEMMGDAEHISKKKAEQMASQKACERLGVTV